MNQLDAQLLLGLIGACCLAITGIICIEEEEVGFKTKILLVVGLLSIIPISCTLWKIALLG